MKKLIFLIFVSSSLFGQQLDTIYAYCDICEGGSAFLFYPKRAYVVESDLNNNNRRKYIDSIRGANNVSTVIFKYHKEYYFKGFGKDSVLRVEGVFFDSYPSRNIIEYDKFGDTLRYGDYKVVKRKKTKSILSERKLGNRTVKKWKSYYYCYKEGWWVNYDRKSNKTYRTFFDIPNKTIKKIKYKKHLGKLQQVEVIERIKKNDYILNEP